MDHQIDKRQSSQGGLPRNRQAGFIELIIVILVFLFILKYMGLSISDVVNWFKDTFQEVLR